MDQSTKDDVKSDAILRILKFLLGPGFRFLLFGVPVAVYALMVAFNYQQPLDGLEVIANPKNLSKSANPQWAVNGRVLDGGKPVKDVNVWVVASDKLGNQYSSLSTTTNPEGEFKLEITQDGVEPPVAGFGALEKGIVHAASPANRWVPFYKRGTATVIFSFDSQYRLVRPLLGGMLLCLIIVFVLSVIVAMIPAGGPEHQKWRLQKYWITIAFTFLFSLITLGAFGWGHIQVNTTATENEVLSLGVATVFKSSYVKEQQPEWLLSFTSLPERKVKAAEMPAPKPPVAVDDSTGLTSTNEAPASAAPVVESNLEIPKHIDRGLGAPLWVILFAIIGSALFTVVLLVKEIETPPNFTDVEDPTRLRIKEIVLHQLYMLFAPLGGVFLYQLLVLADAASQPVTVAIAALGAGATLNILLAKAIGASQSAVEKMSTVK